MAMGFWSKDSNEDHPVFIQDAGACIVSNSVLDGSGLLKWMVREESMDAVDCGWRFFSDIDDDEYISDSNNLTLVDFNTVAAIEPAVLAIYNRPVGSDLQLVIENGKISFYDNGTGNPVAL